MNILEARTDPKVFGGWLKPFDMTAWCPLHAGGHGLPMTDEQAAIYRKCTGRQVIPSARCREVFVGSGRRSGKSMNVALEACFSAAIDVAWWQKQIAPGQRPLFGIFSVDRQSAKEVKNYCSGILRSSPLLKKLIEKETEDEIYLATGAIIRIQTASFRTSRGPAYIGAALDEVAFMRDSETSANPASEIIASVRPAILPGGILFVISSVYNRSGVLYEQWQKHFGRDGDDVLFWLSDTRTMNPKFDQRKIDREMADDPARAQAEYLSIWRDDLQALYSADQVDAAVAPSRGSLPAATGLAYVAGCDMSGGRRDSSALCIAHRDRSGRLVVDYVQEVRAPHSPAAVVEEFSAILKTYGISQVKGDRYAGEWPVDSFRKHGITYRLADQTASEAYLALLPMFSNRSVELPDDSRLRSQFLSLMRRTSSGGRDSVIVGAGIAGHADAANAVALALVSIASAPVGKAVRSIDGSFLFPSDLDYKRGGSLDRLERALTGSDYDD